MNAKQQDLAIPDDVIDAARRSIRAWILCRYANDRRQLEKWNDHYASLISFQSYSFPGSVKSNLARLKRLAAQGAIIIQRRVSNIYCFTLPRPMLDKIAAEETARYERAGYVVGKIMDAIEVAA